MIACPQCGSPVNEAIFYCGKCGSSVNSAAITPTILLSKSPDTDSKHQSTTSTGKSNSADMAMRLEKAAKGAELRGIIVTGLALVILALFLYIILGI